MTRTTQTEQTDEVMDMNGDGEKDPSQITLPYMDASIKWNGYRLKPIVYAAPGLLTIFFGLIQYGFTENVPIFQLALLVGIPLAMIGGVVAVTTNYELTHPVDRIKGEFHHRLARRRLPKTHLEASSEPVHGYKRIFETGAAEMVDGRYVAFVRIEGRNTEEQTEEQANNMISEATEAIRREIGVEPGSKFDIYATTFASDIERLIEPYEEHLRNGRFAGNEWVYARQLIHDIRAFERHENDAWDARDLRTYAVVEVSPGEIDDPIQTSLSVRDVVTNILEGMGLRSPDPQYRRMRKKIEQRISNVEGVANSLEGVDVEQVGPAEHALLAGKYWTGVEHNFSDENVPTAAEVSVWPRMKAVEEEVREQGQMQAGDPYSHRPSGVDEYLEEQAMARGRARVSALADEEDVDGDEPMPVEAVADVDEYTPVSDVGEAVEQVLADPYRAGVADELFGESETDSDGSDDVRDEDEDEELEVGRATATMAKIREGLLHPLSPGSSGDGTSGEVDASSSPSIQDALAPRRFDKGETHMEAGKQYCKTFWLTGWPKQPNSNYLKELLTRRGIDFDLRITGDPLTKEDAIYLLKRRVGNITADIEDRQELKDLESEIMSDDVEFYMAMYHLLQKYSVRPWLLNGYLTIRVGPTDALDFVEGQIEKGLEDPDGVSMHFAKLRALEETEQEVREILEEEPIGLTMVESPDRHDELFTSGFPASRDVYRERSFKDRTTLCLTGALGATFPFCRSTIQETGAAEIGQAIEHGEKLAAGQHNRGGAPHRLTLADSGSGKSYSDGKQAIRWWLKKEGQTLIFMDTMGGFEQHVQAMNGNHIVVDGSTQINPLEIKEVPEHLQDSATEVDSFGLAKESAVNWILGIVEDEGGDPDTFKPIVKELIRETYREAGIHPEKPETHKPENSPTMNDFLEMMDRAFDNPRKFSLRGHESEGEKVEEELQELSRRLAGFKPGAEYDNLLGESEVRIEPGAVNYLDLSDIEGAGSADSSTMLELMLRNVYETVKVAPEETVFLIDEAHYLLHSARMREWLQQSARHWRHYNAGLWFVTHRPQEFVSEEKTDPDGHKDAIRGQCNVITFYRLRDLEWEDAKKFDLNRNQWKFITKQATTGEAGLGYSTGIVNFTDEKGWYTFEVKAGPFEDALHSWDPTEHGELETYLQRHMPDPVPDPAPLRKSRSARNEEILAYEDVDLEAEPESGPDDDVEDELEDELEEQCIAIKNNGERCTYAAKYPDGKCGIHTDVTTEAVADGGTERNTDNEVSD